MKQYVALFLGALLWAVPALAARNEVYLTIATGDVASGLFDQAGQVAGLLGGAPERNCRGAACTPGVFATAQMSPRAEAALTKLRSGASQLALVPSALAYAATSGRADEDVTAWRALRTLALIDPQPMLILVRAEVKAVGWGELARTRVVLGPRDSDTTADRQRLLRAFGLNAGSYQGIYSEDDAATLTLLTSGRADAAILQGATLPMAWQDALAAGQLRLLEPLKGELVRAIAYYPFLQRDVVDLSTGSRYATVENSRALVVGASFPAPLATVLVQRLIGQQTLPLLLDVNHPPAPLLDGLINLYKQQTPSPAAPAASAPLETPHAPSP